MPVRMLAVLKRFNNRVDILVAILQYEIIW